MPKAQSTRIVDRVYALMRKHRRTTYLTAAKVGLSMRQYQRAVMALKHRGELIDTDIAPKTVTTSAGTKRRVWIATHQLLR